MRVLFQSNFAPPSSRGGTELYTISLARSLKQLGHEPFIICADGWGEGDSSVPVHQDGIIEGIPIRRFYWNWELSPHPFVSMYSNPQIDSQVATYIGKIKPDIVHVTSCYSLGAGVFASAHTAGVPTVMSLTDFWFICPRHTLQRGDGSLCEGPESALGCQKCMSTGTRAYRTLNAVMPSAAATRVLLGASRSSRIARLPGFRGYVGDAEQRLHYLRAVFDDVDLALSPSQFLADTMVRNGYPADRIRLVRHGIHTSSISGMRPSGRPDRPFTFGFTGQIDQIKGVDLIVRAARSLPSKPSFRVSIYGDLDRNPGYTARLRELAADDPRVQLMGAFQREHLPEVLSEIDVLIVPSVWYENAPMVILEAFAARKPVIASALGGMQELVRHDVDGLVFPYGDDRALASSMSRLLTDAELHSRLRQSITPPRTIDHEVEDVLAAYRHVSQAPLTA